MAKCRSRPIFWKSRFWPISRCSTSAVCCPIELKIMWGLHPDPKSSHINFQLNRTTHGGAAASPKWPFLTSKGTPCDFWPFFERPPKRHFWALWGALVCLDRFFSSFWPRTCIFRNLFGPLKSDLQIATFADICPGKKSSKVPISGRKIWKSKQIAEKTHKWSK